MDTTRQASRTQGRFGLLLVGLIAVYLVSAFTSTRHLDGLRVGFFLAVALLGLRSSALRRRTVRITAVVMIAGSAAFVLAVSSGNSTALGASSLWSGLMLMLAVVVIIGRVLAMDRVTLQSIYGALSSYLLIGLMFAAFFAAIGYFGTGDFFADNQPADPQTLQYFSFTTLTTLGYGDFTAASGGGRAVAVLEALTGQIFLATLVARLVSAYRPREPRDPRDYSHRQDEDSHG